MILCVYHSVDADGVGSAALIKLYAESIGEAFVGYPYDYGDKTFSTIDEIRDIIKDDEQDITLFMADCMFESNKMQLLKHMIKSKELANFIWLDHHISSINKSIANDTCTLDGIRSAFFSACELTYRYLLYQGFKAHVAYPFIHHIGLYDCFAGMYNDDLRESTFLFANGLRTFNILHVDTMISFLQGDICKVSDVIKRGEILKHVYLYDIKNKIIPNARTVYYEDVSGSVKYKGLAYLGDKLNLANYDDDSEIRHNIEGYDFLMCINKEIGDSGQVSLYSKTIDCTIIATTKGGGGHRGAAGFRFKDKYDNTYGFKSEDGYFQF